MKDPSTKLYTFSAPNKAANFSPLASKQRRCNHTTSFPPLPCPSLPFASSIFANPNAAIVARSISYSSASPSIHDAFGNRSLSNHSPHSTSHSTYLDAKIPVNCGCRDLRQCFPHGSFVDHFLRRRLHGFSQEREDEKGSSESRFCRSGYVSVCACGEQEVCHLCGRPW